jgi:hypothetical protein
MSAIKGRSGNPDWFDEAGESLKMAYRENPLSEQDLDELRKAGIRAREHYMQILRTEADVFAMLRHERYIG